MIGSSYIFKLPEHLIPKRRIGEANNCNFCAEHREAVRDLENDRE